MREGRPARVADEVAFAPVRVLWVSSVCPVPATDGNRQRNLHLLKAVAQRHEVALVCPVTDSERGSLDELRANCSLVRTVPAQRRALPAATRLGQRVESVLRRRPPFLPQERTALEGAVATVVAEMAPDVVYGGLYVAPVLARAGAPLALDDQNVEEELYRRLWRLEPRPLRKVSRFLDWVAVRSFEREWVERASAVTVCSARDRELLSRIVPGAHLEVVENGADLSHAASSGASRDPETVVMVGSMSYTPNIDGAVHLVNDVMPLVWARRPSARVQIVGKDPAPDVLALTGDRVQVTGEVPDVRPYLDRATLTVVPLRLGGGTRLKLLEAMSAGAPIVSTTLGAEGLGLEHGREAWLATDAAGLGLGVLSLMSDPDRAHAMALAARARAERDLSWDRPGARLAELLAACAAAGSRPSGARSQA